MQCGLKILVEGSEVRRFGVSGTVATTIRILYLSPSQNVAKDLISRGSCKHIQNQKKQKTQELPKGSKVILDPAKLGRIKQYSSGRQIILSRIPGCRLQVVKPCRRCTPEVVPANASPVGPKLGIIPARLLAIDPQAPSAQLEGCNSGFLAP